MTVGSANLVAPSSSESRRSPTTSRRSPTRASSPTSSMSSWPPSSRLPRCYSPPRTRTMALALSGAPQFGQSSPPDYLRGGPPRAVHPDAGRGGALLRPGGRRRDVGPGPDALGGGGQGGG